MSLNICFVMSSYETVSPNFKEPDTSISLMLECQNRGHSVFICADDSLSLENNRAKGIFRELKSTEFSPVKTERYFDEFDIVLIRSNPPVDHRYICNTHILDTLEGSSTLVLNKPSGLRKANEKLYLNNFTDYAPQSVVTSHPMAIKDFLAIHGKAIVKPLDNYGGNGIFFLDKDDPNIKSVIDLATSNSQKIVITQEYLKGADKGDKRIVLIGGEAIASIKRIPLGNDFRANMSKGGGLEICEISPEEKKMCDSLKPKFLEDGLYFAGIDVIDNKIIEINVTSPGFFIRKLNPFLDTRLEETIVDYLELSYETQCRSKHAQGM